jgi:hypothetical protein
MNRTIEYSPIKGTRVKQTLEVSEKLDILEDPDAEPPKGFGCMRIQTIKDGDKRVIWDKTDPQQIAEAELTFNQLIVDGLDAFKVGLDGKKTSEKITEFDAEAEEIIFVQKAMVAGG